jgi:RimJ/RimL family protein N-acetyltransferase
MEHPLLRTQRLVLRRLQAGDAPVVAELAGDRAVADTTRSIPHPYPLSAAEEWIGGYAERFGRGAAVDFAVTLADDGRLLGCTGLLLERSDARAELGYWIGRPYWNRGFAREAAAAIVAFAFGELGLNRVYAYCMRRNPASRRVLERVGLVHEGCCRQHMRKWDTFEDIDCFGLLREDYLAPRAGREAAARPDHKG